MEIVLIEAVLMPNNEVIHFGKTLGFIDKKQRDLVKSKATKTAKGGEMIIALRQIEKVLLPLIKEGSLII